MQTRLILLAACLVALITAAALVPLGGTDAAGEERAAPSSTTPVPATPPTTVAPAESAADIAVRAAVAYAAGQGAPGEAPEPEAPAVEAPAEEAPAVEAPPPPPPVGPAEAADIVRGAFARFGPVVQEQAVRIATCESRLDPTAVGLNRDRNPGRNDVDGHSTDWGLMQLNSYWNLDRYLDGAPDYQQALDPHWNAETASQIYARGGWNLWSTGKYLDDPAAYASHCGA